MATKGFVFNNVPPKSINAVRTGHIASGTNQFGGTINNPTTPRNLSVTFGVGWDGGNVTIVGTNQFNEAITEVFVAAPATVVVGKKIFKTVSSITKANVGVSSATASVGVDNKLGISADALATTSILVDGVTPEISTVEMRTLSFTPATAPNGQKSYTIIVNIAD